jgi:N-methylhydantoinase A
VNLRLSAVGKLPPLAIAQPMRAAAARQGRRRVVFGGAASEAAILWREGLLPGAAVPGPAVIEALDSTTVIPPGWTARVADHGFLRLVRS